MNIRDMIPFNKNREHGMTRTERSLPPQPTLTPFNQLWNDMDTFFENFFGEYPSSRQDFSLTPRINLSETDNVLQIEAEMPGMEEKDIELAVDEGHLVMRGEKRRECNENDGGRRRIECSYGRFERTIPLPDYVKAHEAKAKYRNGVLYVEIPKDPKRSEGKRIPVTAG